MKILTILTKEFFKLWLKHYAPRRFNYEYATKVLHFRERKSKRLKRRNIICFKKGHTKEKYLNPKLTKNGLMLSLPNYTKTKWWLVPRVMDEKLEGLFSINDYATLITKVAQLFPGVRMKQIRQIAWWILNKEKKKPRAVFTVKKSVFEELQFVPKKEIVDVTKKMRNLKIEGDKI